jgi:hypothetical protein
MSSARARMIAFHGWALVAACLATPVLACNQWDISGARTIEQANRISVSANLLQNGKDVSGTAHYTWIREGVYHTKVNGVVNGTLDGSHLSLKVSWISDTYGEDPQIWQGIGVYEGDVNQIGHIEGSNWDFEYPNNRFGWYIGPVLACADPAPTILSGMENTTDRPGSDYRAFPVGINPADCQNVCLEDRTTCRAWTYVRQGIQGPNPVCRLKNAQPLAVHNDCCISGTVRSPMSVFSEPPRVLKIPAPHPP